MSQGLIPGRFILVVDDSPAVLRSTVLVLQARTRLGVVGFASSRQALSHCRAQSPWLAVLDVRMPEMDGVALARRLRGLDPSLPIVFLTGSPRDVRRRSVTAAFEPPFVVVAKPATAAAVLEAVNTAMARR
ncbi:MAG: response regulator transcription factor [Myxococcota bacterium]